VAMGAHLWGVAMCLAQPCGERTVSDVVTAMAHACTVPGTPLRTTLLMLAGERVHTRVRRGGEGCACRAWAAGSQGLALLQQLQGRAAGQGRRLRRGSCAHVGARLMWNSVRPAKMPGSELGYCPLEPDEAGMQGCRWFCSMDPELAAVAAAAAAVAAACACARAARGAGTRPVGIHHALCAAAMLVPPYRAGNAELAVLPHHPGSQEGTLAPGMQDGQASKRAGVQ